MSSFNWTDADGDATLDNGKPYPASRFENWNPSHKPFGTKSNTLETGESNVTQFRDDLLVSLALPAIPNTSMETMLRLQMHLHRGGIVTLVTEDETIPAFGDVKLAPGAEVSIKLTDSEMLEYTLSAVLRADTFSSGPKPNAAGVMSFAVSGETPDVFFYTSGGALVSTWHDDALDPEETQTIAICAMPDKDVWAATETNGDGFTVLRLIAHDDGTVTAEQPLDRLIADLYTARKSLLFNPATSFLLSVDRSTRELVNINTSSGAITAYAITMPDDWMDAAINEAGTHIVYIAGTELRLYDLDADDGVGTLIKDFGYPIAWPVWLEDGTILLQRGQPQPTTTNTKFTVGRVFGSDPVTTGTFTLTYPPTTGDTTAAIPYTATGTDIADALEVLPSIGHGNVHTSEGHETATLNGGLFIEFEFANDLGGMVLDAPSITNSTDGDLEVNNEGGGEDAPAYDDDVGLFSHGEIFRVNMHGSVLQKYMYPANAFADNEGLVGYSASKTRNKLWIYGEVNDTVHGTDEDGHTGTISLEQNGLVILNLSTGAKIVEKRLLNDWGFFDSDTSGAVATPYYSGWTP